MMRTYVSLLAICLLAASAMGQSVTMPDASYTVYGASGQPLVEDFDSMGAFGWSAPLPNEPTNPFNSAWRVYASNWDSAAMIDYTYVLDVPEGTHYSDDWGGRAMGYNAAGFAGDSDRNLAVYGTGVKNPRGMIASFTNTTGQTMTHVTIKFDHEIHWNRHLIDPNDPNEIPDGYHWEDIPVFVSTDGSTFHGDPLDPNEGIINDRLDNLRAETTLEWFDDEYALEHGMLRRGVGGVIELPEPVADGGQFYLKFKRIKELGWGDPDFQGHSYMNSGIDNLKLVYDESYGDANLDGVVDVGDLGILAANWANQSDDDPNNDVGTWGVADFNGDQVIDVGDLGILAANWGDNLYDAQAAVPEPATLLVLAVGTLVSLRSKRP